ncbi:hypothetical protein EDC96DRAFT_451197 [Choanephora cucurbitarum]|nr:hypothetical protein EDC96DRAFT_451197 [Choanephora cucurbitarum]
MTDSQDPPPTAALLTGAAGAFGAGLLGAIWHTKRKQNQRLQQELAEGIVHTPHIPSEYRPPKMTPAEYAVARQEASLFAFKTLGYGTLLAFSGAGLLALGIGYWLDVRNVSSLYFCQSQIEY